MQRLKAKKAPLFLELPARERYACPHQTSTRSGTLTSFLIFLAVIAAMVFWAISIYNRLINERNRVRNAFAQIDVQLTRRYDLIPNLVEAVKGYMKHERETLEAVIKARNAAQSSLEAAKADPANADAIKKLGASEGALGAVLGRLFALSEAYPDLKANQNMMQFQEELASTENKVAFARQAFRTTSSRGCSDSNSRVSSRSRPRRSVTCPTSPLPDPAAFGSTSPGY
jgi:LemA protein